MPHVRVAHRAAPVAPTRPVLPAHRMRVRHPVNQHRPVAPRILPILQAPTFSNRSDIIFENKGEQNLPSSTTDHERTEKTTQQISVQIPKLIPQQNYPTQLLPHLTTRSIRHTELKYTSHLYPSQ